MNKPIDIEKLTETWDYSAEYLENNISSLDKRVDTLEKIALDTSDAIIAGVEVDYENNVSTRIKGATGKSAGTDYNVFPCFANIRRCNMTADGTVTAYYGDSTFKEDGTNGDVMVEIPKLYYKMTPLKLDGIKIRKAQYMVCHEKLLGFKTHPAFVRDDGSERDAVYVSAYEGSLYDTSASAFISDDAQVADFDNDKMVSIANVKPMSGSSQNLTRANSEKLATNKGNGWHCETIQSASLVQLLMLIEYSGNLQSTLGASVTGVTDVSGKNCSINTGSTSTSGNTSYGTLNNEQPTSYRGIENPYGNIWKLITGLTMYNNVAYICDTYNFVEDTINGYTSTNITAIPSNGWVSAFGYNIDFDWIFIPSEGSGSSSGIIGDYAYAASNYRISILGGRWSNGSGAGGFFWNLTSTTSYSDRDVGARLCYEG